MYTHRANGIVKTLFDRYNYCFFSGQCMVKEGETYLGIKLWNEHGPSDWYSARYFASIVPVDNQLHESLMLETAVNAGVKFNGIVGECIAEDIKKVLQKASLNEEERKKVLAAQIEIDALSDALKARERS